MKRKDDEVKQITENRSNVRGTVTMNVKDRHYFLYKKKNHKKSWIKKNE